MQKRERAVVLLSGGMDSTTCLAVAVRQGFEPWPMMFAYGQRHGIEVEAAMAVADYYAIPRDHRCLLDLGRALRGSALTGDAPVPLDRDMARIGDDIPPTYVPARNLVFLALAASWAEAIEARHIVIGVNALDYSGYPDCRPEFIAAFREAVRLGTKAGVEGRPVEIHTPLIRLGKADIVRLALELGAPLHLTHSCYLGVRPACGRCDACQLRLKGFREAGFPDPIPYAVPVEW